MNPHHSVQRPASWLAALLIVSSLAGCFDDDDAPAAPPPAAVVNVSGNAAVGAPLANASVSAQCVTGPALTGTTAADGSWSIPMAGSQSFPCFVTVKGGTPQVELHSIAQTDAKVNVTPLTDLVLAAAAGADPKAWFTANSANIATALPALVAKLPAAQTRLVASLTAAGFTVPAGDLLTLAFKPVDGDAYDDLLELIKISLADSGKTYADLVASTASGTTSTAMFSATRYITSTDVASTPALNSSSVSISGDVLTMKTYATAPSAKGAFIGGGQGNKAILEIPGLAGIKLRDLKSVAMEIQLVTHDVPPEGGKPYYGNGPYFNFLVDLNCNMEALPAGATITDARARRRHIAYVPGFQVSGASVSSATFAIYEAADTDAGWGIGGTPKLGMSQVGTPDPRGTMTFDFTTYPDACIVDGVSADGGMWRDKTADTQCLPDTLPAASTPAKCGRAYKGGHISIGDSGNLNNMEWKIKSIQVNSHTYRFK